MSDDKPPKDIDHDPNEPPHSTDHAVSPEWVVGIAAVLLAVNLSAHGLPKTGWLDFSIAVLFGLFCLWNYWPRR